MSQYQDCFFSRLRLRIVSNDFPYTKNYMILYLLFVLNFYGVITFKQNHTSLLRLFVIVLTFVVSIYYIIKGISTSELILGTVDIDFDDSSLCLNYTIKEIPESINYTIPYNTISSMIYDSHRKRLIIFGDVFENVLNNKSQDIKQCYECHELYFWKEKMSESFVERLSKETNQEIKYKKFYYLSHKYKIRKRIWVNKQ